MIRFYLRFVSFVLLMLYSSSYLHTQTVVTSFKEDFTDAVNLDLWRPNTVSHGDGTPAFDVSQVNGVLHNVVNQVNFYDGQNFKFTQHENIILDISGNPYVTFDVKVDLGAVYMTTTAGIVDTAVVDSVAFLVSPWGPDSTGTLKRQFLALQMNVPADGKWHTMRYDISTQTGKPDFNGTILANDLTGIQAVLVENVIWPGRYAFTMDMDNFTMGEAAAPPQVVTSYKEDFTEPVSLALWRPNTVSHGDGTPAFDVSQVNGVLHNVVNQVNFYDGQNFKFTQHENIILDISGNPYVTFDVKVDPGAVYMTTTAGIVDTAVVDSVAFLVSPWGPDSTGTLKRQFLALQMNVPADGKWHTMRYDISTQTGKPDFNGTILANDLTGIQAVLVENVIWPGRYAFTMDMDNFTMGEAAAPNAPIQYSTIPVLRNKFWAEWKVTPTHAPMNGSTGMANGPTSDLSDMGIIVTFNPSGKIEANNGSNYEALNEVLYQKDSIYTIEIIGDVSSQTYNVRVREGAAPWIEIGKDFAFNTSSSQNNLNYFAAIIDQDAGVGSVPDARLNPSFSKGDYVLGHNNIEAENMLMEGTHLVTCKVMPTANKINAGYSLSSATPTQALPWGEFSTIVRFNTDGLIDVRDGNTYNADANMTYSANTVYTIVMDVDVPNKKYGVKITPEGGATVDLASDYDFRVSADVLNFAEKTVLTGTDFGGAKGDLVITDVEFITGTDDVSNKVNITMTPNPASDFIKIVCDNDIELVKFYALNGRCLKKVSVNANEAVIPVNDIQENAVLISIHSNGQIVTKKFVLVK